MNSRRSKASFLIFTLILSACNRVNTINLAQNEESEVFLDILKAHAAEIVSTLDDNALVSQLLISGIDGNSALTENNSEMLSEIPAGGIILFRYNLNTDNDSIRSHISQTVDLIKEKSGIPPFVSVDHEGGVVNRFNRGVASLPAASSYWESASENGIINTLSKIEEDSYNSGYELKGLGINMNFAPVAEQLIAENRVFLQRRSFGPDPYFVMMSANAFIIGMEQAGVLCVVKHFPGTAGRDPHISASVLNFDKDSLDSLILPFAGLIKNGAKAIMASHTKVPVIDDKITSLSSLAMDQWLRGELGFDGIIISDDFTMAAAGTMPAEEAAVRSVAAGCDMILVWPAHLRKTHEAFISALEKNILTRERLIDAAQRIIYEKLKMGLFE